jgi:integrase
VSEVPIALLESAASEKTTETKSQTRMKQKQKSKNRIWVKVAEGCYFNGVGIEIRARIGSKQTKLLIARDRFPATDAAGRPYSLTHNKELVIRRAQLLEDLRAGRIGGPIGAPGSLAFAIERFLEARPVARLADGRKDPDDRLNDDLRYRLAHWTRSNLANVPITAIRKRAIADVLDAWTNAGVAASTVNLRKRALGAVLRVELDKRKRTDADDDPIIPTDLIPDVPPPDSEPRGVSIPILLGILAEVPDQGRAIKGAKRPPHSETKIRFAVMIWSGMSHASLKRLAPTAVHFGKEKIRLPQRRKGRGAPAVWVRALPQLIAALRAYDAAGLWLKGFSNSSMHSSWRRAYLRRRAKLETAAQAPDATIADKTLWEEFRTTVPDNCHPYDTRHSFLTEVLRRTGDRTAAKELGQHRTERMLDRYTKGAVAERSAAAIETLRAFWAPDAPPASSDALRLVEKKG